MASNKPLLLFNLTASMTQLYSGLYPASGPVLPGGDSTSTLGTPVGGSHRQDSAWLWLLKPTVDSPFASRKELAPSFRLPGKQALTEQTVYVVLYNLLNGIVEHRRGSVRRTDRETPSWPHREHWGVHLGAFD
jgi:hypothetical protein